MKLIAPLRQRNIKSQITYPLLPFSKFVYDLTRKLPQSSTNHHAAFLINTVSIEQVHRAIYTALLTHPVFSMKINRSGLQYAEDSRRLLSGPYHKIDIQQRGNSVYVKVTINLVLGDDYSMRVLLEDVINAYLGKSLDSDNYWEYVAEYERSKLSKHYADSKTWLEKEFADASIPVRPTIDRLCITTLLPPKVGLYKTDYTPIRTKIQQLSETKILPIDGIFSLCTTLAIAEYCGADEAALTWAYEGRETPDEQRIIGSLHCDIPFQIKNIKSQISNPKSDLIREARNQIRSGIAHSDYPYTLTAPYNKRWNYAVNVLRVADEDTWQEMLPSQVKLLPMSPQKYAYALLDVEIHEHQDDLSLWFRYSATHYKESSIHRFASLVRKYVEWLLEE